MRAGYYEDSYKLLTVVRGLDGLERKLYISRGKASMIYLSFTAWSLINFKYLV